MGRKELKTFPAGCHLYPTTAKSHSYSFCSFGREDKRGILEQVEYFLVDTNLSAALFRIHKSPCGYNKFWMTELMTTRSLSFLVCGMAAILICLTLHCLMIFYNAELLQPQSEIYAYFSHLCIFKTYHHVCPIKMLNRYVSKKSQ